jgi:hypothetical protein
VRRAGVIVALVALLLFSGSASAVQQQSRPTVFTGYGFDACAAPSLGKLQAWSASPYRAVGIYIGGQNRACKQPNLTPVWVSSAVGLGWSLMPLYVGLQAPCVSQSGLARISSTVATALAQGKAAADDAAAQAEVLGLPAGSPVYNDLEGYKLGNASCTRAVQSFVTGWVQELHARGLVAGLYGSAASTIRDVSALASDLPDAVWIADWNGVEGVFGDPYVSDSLWVNHQRIHQYKGGHNETYGGVTINIDSNVVDSTVVGGTAPPPPPPPTPPAGSVTSADGLASVSWPAAAFTTQAVVTLTTSGAPPAPATYAVQLAATETDNQAPITSFAAPVTLHLLRPIAGSVPAFSPDGTTWQQLPQLTSAGLSATVPSAYSIDPDGTAEIQTLVPGLFGVVPDTTPPSRPLVTARLAASALSLTWPAATDNVGVAAYNVLRNGTAISSLPADARRATVRGFSSTAPNVYRVQALDAAGNAGQPSKAVVVVSRKRPATLPRAIPQWAYALYSWQHGGGARPAAAPKKPPAWYWVWAGWRVAPFKLR